MNHEGRNLAPISPKMSGRGLPLPPRMLVISVVVALVAFSLGVQLSNPRVVSLPAPSVPLGSIALSLVEPQSTPAATVTPTRTPVAPPTLLPIGLYHLGQAEAAEIAVASRFYVAYNAGQLATVMSLLSADPQLLDCNYATDREVTVDGRLPIEAYFRGRFADHDQWTVEFYQETPDNPLEVVVLPLARSNDTLRSLGAPQGKKTSFPEDFTLFFNSHGTLLNTIAWRTMPGVVGGGSEDPCSL